MRVQQGNLPDIGSASEIDSATLAHDGTSKESPTTSAQDQFAQNGKEGVPVENRGPEKAWPSASVTLSSHREFSAFAPPKTFEKAPPIIHLFEKWRRRYCDAERGTWASIFPKLRAVDQLVALCIATCIGTPLMTFRH